MADRVLSEHQIMLNGNIFPIDGSVTERLLPRFPPKQITGDYSYSNENILSNWIISSQEGGMLVDEMDEAKHAERYFWSTCDTRFRGNLTLGALPTMLSIASAVVPVPTIVNGDMELTTGWTGGVGRSNEQAHGGTYSWKVNSTGGASQNITPSLPGAQVTVTGWVYGASTKIGVYDGATTTYSSTGSAGTWTQVSAVKTLSTSSTVLQISFFDPSAQVYYDDVSISVTTPFNLSGTAAHAIEFNGKLYWAIGTNLVKLNATGDGWTFVGQCSATITDLVQNGTNLFVLLNTNAYRYLDTSELWSTATPTGAVTAGNLGIWWNAWLVLFDTAGACKYSASPAGATPAYTANGTLPIASNELQVVFNYFDATGDDIIYCSTKVGLFAHDTTNAKFLATALKVPSHPTAGLGAVVWHDASFISAGLSVNKYIAGTRASIQSMGLDMDDGVPQLRSGEIVKFIEGYNEFFALVDSTYEGTTSRSQVVSYDGTGWRTWWEETSNNKNMYSGIVSSVYAYRLWFSTTDGIYYIPLQVTSLAPKRISGYTYALSGVHISPRFDSGSKPFPKVATKLTIFLANASSTETVNIGYQIDASTAGAIATTVGWTMFAAQTTNGTSELTFASSTGLQFYDIQFRTALARASGTTTLSPNVKGMVLSYYKATDKKLAWDFVINTAEAAEAGSSPAKLVALINTILTTNTLMTFTFHDGSKTSDTHYVLVEPYAGRLPTGTNWDGKISLTVIEP